MNESVPAPDASRLRARQLLRTGELTEEAIGVRVESLLLNITLCGN